ncbi:hypothetical protein C7B76_25480 [filamentous cyanobacterium CCP2]|nr:hypothetical protein C7B76_25480 [filamentous cyanobacterium CCP2]
MRGLQLVSRVLLGIVLVMLCAGVAALISMAPVRIAGGIASVYLGEWGQGVRVSGHQFTCTQEPTIDRCTVRIQEQPLSVQVNYGDTERRIFNDTVTCQATYSDRPVGCEVSYYFTTDLPILSIREPLGLSQQTLQQLYRENFLIQVGRDNLFRWSGFLAIASGLLIALNFALFSPPLTRSVAGAINGTAGLLVAFATRGTFYSFLGVAELSLLLGVGLGILLGVVVWSCSRQIARVISGLSLGFMLTGVIWAFSVMLFLALGYAA